MYISKIISYNNGWEKLNNEKPELLNEIRLIFEKININSFNLFFFNKNINYNTFTDYLYEIATDLSWNKDDGLFITKDKTNLLSLSSLVFPNWLYSNLKTSFNKKQIDIGIVFNFEKEEYNKYFYENDNSDLMFSDFNSIGERIMDMEPLNVDCKFIIIGLSDEEKDINLVEIKKDTYKKNEIIEKSIEFPSHLKQAGISILNNFARILDEDFPDTHAKIKIEQDGNLVRMIIESEDSEPKVIEEALEEYSLVMLGKKSPEDYTTDPVKLMEIKNELNITKVQIENAINIIAVKDQQILTQQSQIDKLNDILFHSLTKEESNRIEFNPNITVKNNQEQKQHQEQEQLQKLKNHIIPMACELNNLANELSCPILKEEAQNIVDKTDSISINPTQEKVEESGILPKVKRFMDKAKETTELVDTAKDTYNKLATHYNGLASTFGISALTLI